MEQNDFKTWYLHDAELVSADYDYQKNILIIKTNALEKPNSKRKSLNFYFKEIKKINILSNKPWGGGDLHI